MNHTDDQVRDMIDVITKRISASSCEADLTQLLIQRAHYYNLISDEVNSVRDYLSALDSATNDAEIVHIKCMVALALARKGEEQEQALYWAMSAVNQDSCNAEGFETLGLICEVCGFLNLAVDSLRRSICLDPNRWNAIRVLGSSLRENGQVEEAIETLSRYVANNPNEPIGLYDLAWTLHLAAGGDVEKLVKVKEIYEHALTNKPSQNLRALIERKLEDVTGMLK